MFVKLLRPTTSPGRKSEFVSGKEFPMPAAEDIRLTDILRALSDPGRVRMLALLADDGYHACTVETFGLDVQKSTLSHHFKTLREAGLTETRVLGRNHDVRLRRQTLDARFPGLIDSLTSPAAIADLRDSDTAGSE